MRSLLICFLVFLATLSGPLQARDKAFLDSLLKELPRAKEDTIKAKLYFDLCVVYANQRDTAALLANADAWLRLAQKLRNPKEISYAYIYMGEAYCQKQDYKRAVQFGLKGLDMSRKTAYQKGEAFSLQNLGNFYYYAGDTANSRKYRELGRDFCQKTGDKKGLSELYYRWGLDVAGMNDYKGAIGYWSKSLQLKEEIGERESTTYGSALFNLGQACLLLRNNNEATGYFMRLLDHSRQVQDTGLIAKAHFFIGRASLEAHEYGKGLEHALKAHELYLKAGDQYWTALSLNLAGNQYCRSGLYDKATAYQLGALRIAEQINDNSLYPVVLNDLIVVYEKVGKFDKALDYLYQAKARFKKNGDKWLLGMISSNIGTIYRDEKKYDKALAAFREAISVLETVDGQDGIAASLNEMGLTYLGMGNYADALAACFRALEINRRINDQGAVATNLGNIGAGYLQVAQHKDARLPDSLSGQPLKTLLQKSIRFLEQAIQLARETNAPDQLLENYDNLARAQELNGEYKAALHNYKLRTLYHDSLFGSEKLQAINTLDMQYDFEKKEAAIKAENSKRSALAAAAYRDRLRLGVVIGLAALTIVVTVFYLNRKREQTRFQLQQAQLQQEATKARLDTHFVNGAIMTINEFMEENDKQTAADYLQRFSRLIRNVLNNSFETTISLEDDIKFLDDYFQLARLRYPEGHISYDLQVDKDIDPSRTLVPPMVFQVLVENALRHGFNSRKGGHIRVSVSRRDRMLYCTVEDNGIGLSTARASKKEQRISHGTSLAEKLIRLRKKGKDTVTFQLEDMSDETGNITGTKAILAFPLMIQQND